MKLGPRGKAAITAALAFALLPITARAEAPDGPRPTPTAIGRVAGNLTGKSGYSARTFWLESVALTAANVADGFHTVNMPTGWVETEARWLLGKRPNGLRYALAGGGYQAAQMFAAWKLEHSRRRWLRVAGHALMVGATVDHMQAMARSGMVGRPGVSIINPTWSFTPPQLPARPVLCTQTCF